MRKYIHWLKIDRYVRNDAEQWKEIQKYLDNYPEAKATIFTYDSGNFNRVVKLVCCQEYNELDMDVNSLSTNLQRLSSKPQGITERGEFVIPDSVKKRIVGGFNMNKQELHDKRYVHEKAYIQNNMEVCNSILEELKAGKYDVLVSLLKNCEWQLAYEWINNNA